MASDKDTLSEIIDDSSLINKLNSDLGYYDLQNGNKIYKDYSKESFNEAIDSSIKFNNDLKLNKEYVATVKLSNRKDGTQTVYAEVQKRNNKSLATAKEMQMYRNLNLQLTAILKKYGIGVGIMDEYEQ